MIRRLSITLMAVATIAMLATLPHSPLEAQSNDYGAIQRMLDGESAAIAITALSTHTPIVLKYVGSSSAGGTVAVAAGGDMSLAIGPVGSSAADTTVNTAALGALCGATPGTLDLSTPASTCDTLGEVCSVINRSANWRCILRDGMAADSSDNTLATLSEAAANAVNGLALLGDSAVTFDVAAELTSERDISRCLDTSRQNAIVPNPAAGSRVALFQAIGTSTYGSGTSTFEVFSCKTLYPTQYASGAAAANLSETCTQLESQAGGATTAAKTFSYPFALESRKSERLIVRLNNSAAMTAATLYAYGRVAPLK